MHIETLDIEAVFDRLHTRPEGLSSTKVQKRQAEHGLNLVERVEGESMWRVFRGEFTHFFAIILWVAVALSAFAAWQQPGEGMGTLAVAIAAVIVVNGVFSFWQRYKAEQTLTELERLLPTKVSVKRAGRVEVVDAAQIVPGDVLLLDAGERVPADCRLVESFDLRVNNATVTGESMPLSRTASPSNTPGLLEIPALGLGAEEPEPSVMDHPPHRPGEHLLDKTVVGRAFGLLGPLEGVAGLVAYFGVLFESGWSYGETLGRQDPVYLQATTACFAAIVVMQLVNLVHCRDDTTSSLRYGLSGNRVLWAGLAFEVAVLVAMVYLPLVQELFATAPLAAHHWLWFVPMAATFWLVEEVRKFLVRRRRDKQLEADWPQGLEDFATAKTTLIKETP